MHHAAVAKNLKTDRFHPIAFRPDLPPGRTQRTVGKKAAIKHVVTRVHPAGFDTLETARGYIAQHADALKDSELIFNWSGDETPKTTWYFEPVR